MFKYVLICALLVATICSPGSGSEVTLDEGCPGSKKVLRWPVTSDCQHYIDCLTKKTASCLPPLRFNRKTLTCDWYWRVDCTAVPQYPESNV